jgi:hypothetical protein
MLSFPPAVRIWLVLAPADLRKGFDALAELERQHLRDDPLSGHVFVFRNRRGDRIELLYWDSDGTLQRNSIFRWQAGLFLGQIVPDQGRNDNLLQNQKRVGKNYIYWIE